MGSLMAGWDSPISDPMSVKLKRNQSLTKDEIEAYWRAKKKNEEEHLKAISIPDNNNQESAETKFQRSSSLPTADTKEAVMNMDKDTDLEKFIKKHGWWTRSNWAFLNEPPALESSSKSYASQLHIANLAASKSKADTGISTH